MTSTEEKIIVVSWDGDDDPENPKNWTNTQKWIVTGLISTSVMLSHMSSSMIAPAARDVAKDLGSTSPIFEPLLTSVFILAYAFGFLYFVSITHVLGRSRVVQLANVFYIVSNILCAFAKDPTTMCSCRFFAGVGASAPLALRGDIISDCWSAQGPSRGVALLAIPPLLGPVIGPIVGAWLVMNTTWKWIFWSTSIAAVFVQVGSFFWLKETCAPLILARKARRLQNASSGEESVRYVTSHQQNLPSPSLTHMILLLHPVFLLLTEPMIQLLGIYMAYIYGLIYLILTSIPDIFIVVYHESLGIAGLHYIAFGIGLYGGAQISDATQNELYRHLSARYGTNGCPEYRIPIILPATLLVTIGLLITGWSITGVAHWVVPDIGLVIIGIGITVNWKAIQGYLIDTYTVRATPAHRGLSVVRSLGGFALPLCSPSLYQNLGYGKGNTILAGWALGIGILLVLILWFSGTILRRKSAMVIHD